MESGSRQWNMKIIVEKSENGYNIYDETGVIGRFFPHNDDFSELEQALVYVEGLISAENECFDIIQKALQECQATREHVRKPGYGETSHCTERDDNNE